MAGGFGGTGLELSILISAHETASRVMRGLGGIFKGALGDINSGLHSITTGFQTMGTGAGGVMASLGTGAASVATGLLAIAGIAVLVGGAIAIAIGVVAVKAAADFQQGLNRLVTGAGDVTDNMAKMGQAILGVSVDTGLMTDKLLPAMYLIISSGQRGAQALDTLAVAAKGAVIEQANVADVANVLSGVMTNYGTKTYNATQFMNGLITAVQQGKITLQQLAVAMGPLDPIAKSLGVSFNDVAAAMTTQTNAMIPAAVAATGLRFLLQSMENPTHKATAAMNKYGLDTVKVANEMKTSLPGALEMIFKAALKAGPEGSVLWNRAVQDMTGGMRSWRTALALSGTHMMDFIRNSQLIKAAMDHNKTAVIGWDVAQSGFNVQMSRAKAGVQALLITIGTALLPVITQIVASITPVIAAFTAWILKSHAIEKAIAFLGPLFAATFSAIKTAMGIIIPIFALIISKIAELVTWIGKNKAAMDALKIVFIALGVIIAIGLIVVLLSLLLLFGVIAVVILVVVVTVMALVAAANWLAGAWRAAVAWISEAWNTLKGAAVSVWNAVKNAIVSVVNGVINWLKNAWDNAVRWVVNAFTWLYNHNYYWKWLVDTIRNVVSAVVNWLKTAWTNAVNWVVTAWNWLKGQATTIWNAVSNWIKNAVNAVITWLQGAWTKTVAWIGEAWNKMKGLAQSAWDGVKGVFNAVWGWISGILSSLWTSISGWWTGTVVPQSTAKANQAWQGVSQVFSSAWGRYISGPLNSLWASISGWISSTANGLYQAGLRFMQMLANGISAGVGWVKNAVSSAAQAIWSALGFHSPPKSGPAKDSDKWMPNMVKMLQTGIIAGAPQIQSAVNLLLQPVQRSMTAPLAITGGRVSPLTRTPSGNGGDITVNVTIGNINDFSSNMPATIARQLTNAVEKEMSRRYRGQWNNASGGVN